MGVCSETRVAGDRVAVRNHTHLGGPGALEVSPQPVWSAWLKLPQEFGFKAPSLLYTEAAYSLSHRHCRPLWPVTGLRQLCHKDECFASTHRKPAVEMLYKINNGAAVEGEGRQWSLQDGKLLEASQWVSGTWMRRPGISLHTTVDFINPVRLGHTNLIKQHEIKPGAGETDAIEACCNHDVDEAAGATRRPVVQPTCFT